MKYKILIRISGFCGVILPIFFIGLIIWALSQSPWFSWTENAISDFGRFEHGLTCFNYGFIIIGIFILIFSFGLYFSLKDQRAGPTVFALSALYLMAVGLYPLPSMEHIDLSALFFIAFPFGFVLFGLRNLNDAIPFKKKMSIFALAVFIIAAFSSVLLLIFNGIAIPEILIFFPGIIWFMIYGFYLIFYKNS